MIALGNAPPIDAQSAPPTVGPPVSFPAARRPVPSVTTGPPVLAPTPASPATVPGRSAGPTSSSSAAPAGRFHLHRPGTDVDGDLLTGNAASDVFIFHGNVVLHSDPKVDRAFASSTESDDPITVDADEIDVDRAGLTYLAKGHVHFVQGSRSGKSDTAMLNEQTHDLDLLGNADVMDGDHRARAAKMHYNTLDRQFHGAGDVRIYEPAPTPNPSGSPTVAPKRRRRFPI